MKNFFKNFVVILLVSSMLLPNFVLAIDNNNSKEKLKTSKVKNELTYNLNEKSKSYNKFKNFEDNEELTEFEKNMYSKEYLKYLELSDEEKRKVSVIPRKYDVPMSVLYDESQNIVGASVYDNNDEEKITLPSQFDLRDYINIPEKNQTKYGLCWTFASLRSLETYLALNGYGDYDFSEWHLGMSELSYPCDQFNSYNTGGNFDMFCNYLTDGYGPVLEEDAPYDTYISKENYDIVTNTEKNVYVNEVEMFPTIIKTTQNYTEEELKLFREKVKEHIVKNGSLYTAIASSNLKENLDGQTILYCNEEDAKWYGIDHAISVIGWDDNYSRENFKYTEIVENESDESIEGLVEDKLPENDGAYIILNSWGNENEIIYVSYEDAFIESEMCGVCSASLQPDYEEVQIADENLYNALLEELGRNAEVVKEKEQTIRFKNNSIFSLDLSNRNITNLSGIEVFKKLNYVDVSNNKIEDLSPLWNLPKLKVLDASFNNLSNIENVPNLPFLWFFGIVGNNVKNIDFIQNFSYLNRLAISNNEIKDISVIKNLNSLEGIWLENNEIEDVSALENYCEKTRNDMDWISWMINGLDLSGNPIKLGLDKILPNSIIIQLNNCGIDDEMVAEIAEIIVNNPNMKFMYLADNDITDASSLVNCDIWELTLSGNKNLDISTICDFKGSTKGRKDETWGITGLFLEDCDIKDEDINSLKNLNFKGSLNLAKNPISDISSLKDKELNAVVLNDTNVTDISSLNNTDEIYISNVETVLGLENLTNVKYLSLNGIENLNNLEMLENLNQLESLVINNCGLTNIDFVTSLNNLSMLNLSDNLISDISALANLKNLFSINFDNNEIVDISVIETMLPELYQNENGNWFEGNGLQVASFINNKITNIENFSNQRVYHKNVDLSLNLIKNIPANFINYSWKFDLGNVEENYTLKKKAVNSIKLPYVLKQEFLSLYNCGYENVVTVTTENCSVDLDKNIISIDVGEKDDVAKIIFEGYFKDLYGNINFATKTYEINYTVFEDLELEGIYVDSSSKSVYFENEEFNKKDLVVYEVYTGGIIVETDDYAIINSNEDNGELVIESNKNPEFRANLAIVVYKDSSIVPLNCGNEKVYNYLKENTEYFAENRKAYPVLKFDDDNFVIYYFKASLNEITYLSLDFNDEILSNLIFLRMFPNLGSLYIKANEILDISKLVEQANLKEVEINLGNDQDIENIITSEKYRSFDYFNISSNKTIENCKNVEYVELPNYMYQAIKLQENVQINASVTYWDNDENYLDEEVELDFDNIDEKVSVKLNKEHFENEKSSERIISIDVLGGNCPNSVISFTIFYDIGQELEVEIEDIKEVDDQKYINKMAPNTRIFDLRNKISTNGEVEIYKGEERIYNLTEKLATGMIVRVVNGEETLEYKVVITGDLTGNGQAGDADLLKFARYKVELDTNLVDEFLEATDINQNNENTEDSDLLKLARILVGLEEF